MPSAYAHYRFGVQIIPSLPADVRRTIARNRSLFDAGLQGPDPLFYYKPMSKNDIVPLASNFHRQSGGEFFERICRKIRRHPTEETLAYLYGVLAHYCLDSLCHPFVNEMTKDGPVSHNELESEFERYLLRLDGVKRPFGINRGVHLKLKKDQCAIPASFYPPVTPEQFYQAMKSMSQTLYWLSGNTELYHGLADRVLKFMGGQNPGLLMRLKSNPACSQYNSQMLAYFNTAVEQFPLYLEQLRSHITFSEPLGEEFTAIFG